MGQLMSKEVLYEPLKELADGVSLTSRIRWSQVDDRRFLVPRLSSKASCTPISRRQVAIRESANLCEEDPCSV